ncbi:hypothetical protein [Nocardiopsis composta]|uniref:Uncharacterized protein n=1 Tax=Nocardiopsis composta TaxID=157465 RepID=A0A7W8QK97_9ACTN|nr:hypothetical protein [Nocardiopsis composta]MBB5431325.1 hypothetical protein [Nocardiopsis composta]
MRAPRFQDWLLEQLQADLPPAVSKAASFAEAGYTERPLGVALALSSGASVYVQIVRGSPDDGSDRKDEEPVVTGKPPAALPAVELPVAGSVRTADVEGWLAHAVSASGHSEIAQVKRYSTDPDLGSDTHKYGVKVSCHSGADIYLLFVHTLRSGDSPSAGSAFRQLEAV